MMRDLTHGRVTTETAKPRKVYRGMRRDGEWVIVVNDQPVKHVVWHSPSGMAWGYGGSGPADAALSILAEYFGEAPTKRELFHGLCRCWHLHQDFKWDFLAHLPQDGGWEIRSDAIDQWLKHYKGIIYLTTHAKISRVFYWELYSLVPRASFRLGSNVDMVDFDIWHS